MVFFQALIGNGTPSARLYDLSGSGCYVETLGQVRAGEDSTGSGSDCAHRHVQTLASALV